VWLREGGFNTPAVSRTDVPLLCQQFATILLSKAYDKVNHNKLSKEMVDMEFAKYFVALIRALHENQKSNVRIHGMVGFKPSKK